VVRKLAVLLLLLVPFSVASSSKRFEAPIGDVFSAAVKSIQSHGVVLSANKDTGNIAFVCGWFQGTVVLTEVGSSTEVAVRAARVPPAVTSDQLFWQTRDVGKEILGNIGKVLQDKPVKTNERLQRQSRLVANRLQFLDHPATALIRGTKEDVKSALVAECAARGLAIVSETDHQLTVAKEAANLNIISELLIGNYSIRAYRVTVQFMLVSEADAIRITPIAEALARNGYGATYSTIVTNEPDARAVLQAMLDAAKRRVEIQKELKSF
jgi:hypothetical protein